MLTAAGLGRGGGGGGERLADTAGLTDCSQLTGDSVPAAGREGRLASPLTSNTALCQDVSTLSSVTNILTTHRLTWTSPVLT